MYLNSQIRYITDFQRCYLLNVLPRLPGNHKLRVIIAGHSVDSLGNQGHSVYMCEEGEIVILDFEFEMHTSARDLSKVNRLLLRYWTVFQ